MKISKMIVLCILLFSLISCNKNKNQKVLSHREGEMTIYVDPSNKNLLEALTEIYVMKFPEVQFDFVYKPENQILQDLLDTVAYAAFINTPLSEQQTKYLQQKSDVTPRSTLLAYDAAVFITSIENPKNEISMDEIRTGILEENNKIIFDNGNSGNYNTVKDKLNLKIPEGKSVQALNNPDEVIDFVQKSKTSIGVIGLDVVSEEDSPKVKELLTKIKILSVINPENEAISPSAKNILQMKYPFFKGVYFIVREPGFGIGSGFSRFAGSQQGQLIVRRAGLQPNYLWERQVQVNLKDIQ